MGKQTRQSIGLVPVKELYRCETVPGSHRTSLGGRYPDRVIQA